MMPNEKMKAGRFLRWHKARRLVGWIKEQLAAGKMVQVATYTHAVRYRAQHAEMFKATKSGAYVQRGKNWVCIDLSNIRAF